MNAIFRLLLVTFAVVMTGCTETIINVPFEKVSATMANMNAKAYSREPGFDMIRSASPEHSKLLIAEGYTCIGPRYLTTIQASPASNNSSRVTVSSKHIVFLFYRRFEPKEKEWLQHLQEELSKR